MPIRFRVTPLQLLVVVSALVLGGGSALAQGPGSVSELAKQLAPAVVNISTTRAVESVGVPFPEVPEGSPLEDFLKERNPNGDKGEDYMSEARSLGSGFIIDAKGEVVTNNHVIEGADEIVVVLSDGAQYEASVVGADDKTDLAVLQIEADREFPFVSFGDSDTAEVGDWVMAIGNPFGLGGSVTLGIVSARNRDINAGPYDNFIQTDAAINQGNSGGPLFDMDGNVVGINTAIYARSGGSLGIGFAVPGNLAWPVVKQLAEYGETRRGWLGVGIQDVTLDIAASLGRGDTHGAMVVDVNQDGPSAGTIEDGDIILQFDGKDVVKMRDLPRLVAETEVGKKVKVTVLRNGSMQDFDITLGRLEAEEEQIVSAVPEDAAPDLTAEQEAQITGLDKLIGFTVAPVTAEMWDEYGMDEGTEGLVITEVSRGSDAYDKGLLPGLRIAEVNQHKVASVDEVQELVGAAREAGRPAVLFKVIDPAGAQRFVAVRLE